MDTTVIKNLQRDEKGNFSYRATDGSTIKVAAGSASAQPLESFWAVCQELREAELAKVAGAKKANPLLAPFRWLGRLVSNLIGRFTQRKPVRLPQPTVVEDWGLNHGPDATGPSGEHATAASPGHQTPAPRQHAANGAPRKTDSHSAAGEERPAPSTETFEVEEIRRLPGDAGYFVRFAEGIEVNVPPTSPHAQRFEKAFQQLAAVNRTLDQLDPSRAVANSPSVTEEPSLLTGKIVQMPQSVGGKDRFAFEHEGRSHPIKLSQRESVILKTLLQSGKLKGVAATVEPATLVTIKGLELEDQGRKQTVNFRSFVQQVIKDPSLAQASPPPEPNAPTPPADGAVAANGAAPNAETPSPTATATVPEVAAADAHPPLATDAGHDEEHNVRFEELPPVAGEPPPESPYADLRILIAEDNPVNRDRMNELLVALGCKPELAANGTAAIQAVEGKPYDLVFMDLQMPEIDGFEATKAIRDRAGTVGAPQIIALTADTSEGALQKITAAGITAHLGKPVQKDELLAAMQSFLSTRMKPVSGAVEPPVISHRVTIPDAEMEVPGV